MTICGKVVAEMFEEKHAMHKESSAKCGQKRMGKKRGRIKHIHDSCKAV